MRRRLWGAAALMAASLALAGEAAARTLTFAEFGPNRGTRAAALQWFADELKVRSKGALEIEFFWGKSLLGTKAVLQGVADGVADMGSVIGFFTPKELRAYNIGDLPVENSDVWVGMRALFELANTHPVYLEEFEKAGVVYVANYSTGPIQLICTAKVSTLAELEGKKIRGSGPYGKTLTELGADVVRMGQGEVYQALESGLVDCNQNYYYSMKAYKQYEVAPFVLELDWGQNMSFGIIMNQASFDSLSEEERKILHEVASDFVDHFAKAMIETKAADKAAMIEGIDGKAITVTRLSDAERRKLLEASAKQVGAWVADANGDGLAGDAILEAYQQEIDTYRAEKESKGYPWTR